MSSTGAVRQADRILVLDQMRALRSRGWPAGRSLQFIASHAPPGPLAEALLAQSVALQQGSEPEQHDDPLLALLARGESAGPESLEEASRALALADRAGDALRSFGLVLIAAGLAAIAIVLGIRVSVPHLADFYASYGGQIPVTVRGSMTFLETAGAIGPWAVGGAIVIAFIAWRLRRFPGARGLLDASRLRLYAAAVDAGLSDGEATRIMGGSGTTFLESDAVHLDACERAYGEHVTEIAGTGAAARAVAEEKELSAGRAWTLFIHFLPVLGVAVLAGAVIATMALFFLPIFATGSAI